MMRAVASAALALLASVARPAELDLSYGRDALTGGRPAWDALSLDVMWRRPDHGAFEVALRQLSRFGQHDMGLGLRGAAPLGHGWIVQGEISSSPSHHFMPAWTGAVTLSCMLGSGMVASTGTSWSRYSQGPLETDARIGTLGIERYWGSQRLGWTGYVASVAGQWGGSQRVAWDLFYGEASRVGLGFAAGREVESTGGPQPFVMDVLGASIAGRHRLTDTWGISYEVGVVRQGELYTRTGARLGVHRTF